MWYKGVKVSICASIKLINYKGEISSNTIISTRTEDIWWEVAHTMNNLVQQGKFELKPAVSKRWYVHNVKEFLIPRVPCRWTCSL